MIIINPYILNTTTPSLLYETIPDAPSFGTTTTITPTDTQIETADLAGNTDVILGVGTHAPRVMIVGLVGSIPTPIRFKGAGGTSNPKLTQIGDGTVANQGALRGNTSENIEFYDMYFYGDHVFVWEISSGNVKIQNADFEGDNINGFSGFRSKTDNNAGVAPYDVDISFSRFSNVIGESLYFGQVNGTVYHNLRNVRLHHIFSNHSGRESVQFSHCENLDINHFTGLDAGWEDELSQNRALQIQDCSGVIRNSMFQSFGTLGNAYALLENTDGMSYFNCFFEAEEHLYLGNAEARDWYPNSTIKGNKKKIFDSCILKIATTNTQTSLLQVFLDICDIEVRNCIISDNYLTLFEDSRIDKLTYSLIDGGGNIFVPSNHPAMNPTFDSLGRINNAYHYNRGFGYLCFDPILASYTSVNITGTEQKGEILTANVIGGDAGAGATIDSVIYQWFRSDDIAGLNRIAIVGATASTYLLVSEDETKFIQCEVIPVNDIPMTGSTSISPYTGAIAAAPFSPFTDIAWDIAIRPSGAVDLATNEFWTNEGTGANLAREAGQNIPTYNAGLVDFDRAALQQLTMPGNAYTTDYELWMEFTPDNTNFQVIFALSSSITLRTQSGGELRWANVGLGITLATGITYRIRLYLNGATSTIEVRNDSNVVLLAETVVNLPTSNTGGGNGRLGAQTNSLNAYGGSVKYTFLKKVETLPSEQSNVWTWMNNN